MKKAIIICTDKFPNEDANAVRAGAFALLFKAIGYSPFVIGLGKSTGFKKLSNNGVPYISLRSTKYNYFTRLIDRLLFNKRAKKLLDEEKLDSSDVVFIETCPNSLLIQLKKKAQNDKNVLICDATEWYSPEEFENGEKNIAYKHNNMRNQEIIDESVKAAAISTYFERYFKSKGIDTVRIPVIMDVKNIEFDIHTASDKKIQIVYAGMPGKKDRLQELIDAVNCLSDKEQRRLHLKIVGVTKRRYMELLHIENEDFINPQTVEFLGRKPHNETVGIVRNADFAFLLRPEKERYAMAGFPTKAVESMALGTPMMCNISSDLGIYLEDGKNSVIIESCSAESCLSALKRILSFQPDEISAIKKNARLTAVECFDYSNYSNTLNELILNSQKYIRGITDD